MTQHSTHELLHCSVMCLSTTNVTVTTNTSASLFCDDLDCFTEGVSLFMNHTEVTAVGWQMVKMCYVSNCF